jgi:ribulose-phosphate 3-epimerase
MDLEVIPAILVKDRAELLRRIAAVSSHVRAVHIDVMDDKFVPNQTVGLESFSDLPKDVEYEFHWMVEHPEEYISKVPGPHLHLVHIESVKDWHAVEEAIEISGGTLGIAFNPKTPTEQVLIAIEKTNRVLAMTVEPGFDGQKYMSEVEEKISRLRTQYPELEIEVDGGIGPASAPAAAKAGANKLAAASSIFKADDKKKVIENILKLAKTEV